MKQIVWIMALVYAAILIGCDSPTSVNTRSPAPVSSGMYPGYQAAEIRIVGLSGFVPGRADQSGSQLEVYLEMLDSFGSRIKSPGIIRLELYEFQPRSSDPKGKRIFAWPDFDLNTPSDNNRFWRDFLRAYRFDLSMDSFPGNTETAILEATCLCPDGKRLTARMRLQPSR